MVNSDGIIFWLVSGAVWPTAAIALTGGIAPPKTSLDSNHRLQPLPARRQRNLREDVVPLVTVDGGCTADLVLRAREEACQCDPVPLFLEESKGIDNKERLETYLEQICDAAWNKVPLSSWQDVNYEFTDAFMSDFVNGGTFLNEETGNLREEEVPEYPTSAKSRLAAQDIAAFEKDQLERTILKGISPLDNCQYQSTMCCWGRDRQSNDDNGNCAANDCDDADPADNTNSCLHDEKEEGDIHCHGYAWSRNPNHATTRFRHNTLFYVSLYDHWYKRGYVQNILASSKTAADTGGIPMCGFIEDMPMVTRADCTQVEPDITFNIYLIGGQRLEADAAYFDKVDFQECQGYQFGQAPNNKAANNDLASHLNKLVYQGDMNVSTQVAIFDAKLVGYANPNDNEFAEACDLAMARGDGATMPLKPSSACSSNSSRMTGRHKKRKPLTVVVFLFLGVALLAGIGVVAIVRMFLCLVTFFTSLFTSRRIMDIGNDVSA